MFINSNGDYPKYISDVQAEFPDWEYGDPMPEGWYVVESTEMPLTETTKKAIEVAPVLEDGVYKQSWEIVDKTPEEIENDNAPITVKQKLRDLGFTDVEINTMLNGLIR